MTTQSKSGEVIVLPNSYRNRKVKQNEETENMFTMEEQIKPTGRNPMEMEIIYLIKSSKVIVIRTLVRHRREWRNRKSTGTLKTKEKPVRLKIQKIRIKIKLWE